MPEGPLRHVAMQHQTGPALITLAPGGISAKVMSAPHARSALDAWVCAGLHDGRGAARQRLRPLFFTLHRTLRPDLHHPAGRYLKEVGGIARGTGERDEQPVLPTRDAGMGLGA